VDGFELGTTRLDVPSHSVPSGKGLNVARVVRTLGEDVAVVGLIPKNDLRRFEVFIGDLGITPLLYETAGNARVNITLTDAQAHCVTHINSMSAKLSITLQEEFLRFLLKHTENGSRWCFSGSLPAGFDDDAYSRIITECKDRGANCLLDSRGMGFKMGARSAPQAIKPNLEELGEFFDQEIKGVHHIALCAKRFIDMGIGYAFISLGSDGLIAVHENKCFLCSPPDVKVVDTVGCGDATVAGILVAQEREFSFEDTCRMAVACGSSKSMHEGPGIITREEVWQLMEDVEIKEI
jgi:1-phosphofructokinase family hexose kinase